MKLTTKVLAAGMTAAAIVAAGGATAALADGTSGESSHALRRIEWTSHNPPIAISAPICADAEHCEYPFTGTGKVEGGLVGTYVSAGGAATDTTGTHFAVGRTQLFGGTVAGCGAGTLVLYVTEDATATSASMTWQIAEGYGSGDLTHVSGQGTGSVTGVDGDGVIWTITGRLRCG